VFGTVISEYYLKLCVATEMFCTWMLHTNCARELLVSYKSVCFICIAFKLYCGDCLWFLTPCWILAVLHEVESMYLCFLWFRC